MEALLSRNRMIAKTFKNTLR